jgi:hypothetical protein
VDVLGGAQAHGVVVVLWLFVLHRMVARPSINGMLAGLRFLNLMDFVKILFKMLGLGFANPTVLFSVTTGDAFMSAEAIEKLITNAIHTAFIKYPEGDGGPNLDYDWIPPEQSAQVTKAILLDLEAAGYKIVKKA